jgi:hypothetical protein
MFLLPAFDPEVAEGRALHDRLRACQLTASTSSDQAFCATFRKPTSPFSFSQEMMWG